MLHHIELWVADLAASTSTLGWLLMQLGFEIDSTWPQGTSYRCADFYIVLESGPDVLPARHERCRPGLNHLAFTAGSREDVERLTGQAVQRGFELLFPELHPFAGGVQHYAAYLADPSGFEIELVARDDKQ